MILPKIAVSFGFSQILCSSITWNKHKESLFINSEVDRIGIPNFPVFTGIKLIPIPPVYVFAKNRYTGTVFYTGIVLC